MTRGLGQFILCCISFVCYLGCWCRIPGADKPEKPKEKPAEPCCCQCCCCPCCHRIHHHCCHCCRPCCHCCHCCRPCCHCCHCCRPCCQCCYCCHCRPCCCHCKRSQALLSPLIVRTPFYLSMPSPDSFFYGPYCNVYGTNYYNLNL